MTGQREICGGLRIQFSCLPFMPLHCKIGAEVIALNEKQLQEMEQKAYDNGLFVSKLSKADAETAVRKISKTRALIISLSTMKECSASTATVCASRN